MKISLAVLGTALFIFSTPIAFADGTHEHAEPSKAQKEVKPHIHPVEKGTAPTAKPADDQATADKQSETKAVKEKSHFHPRDGK
jgi:hypothetical protein